MTEMTTEFVGKGEDRSADMRTGMGIAVSSGKGSVMAVSTVTHLAAPRVGSAS
jgi:hypothetical protein